MPRKCTICTHAKRDAIDSALVNGESYRAIAAQFEVSTSALQRHKGHHLPATLAQARNAGEATRGEDLLEQVGALRARALQILTQAEEAGELRTALAAIREARGCLELLARLLGELQESTQINIAIAPQWIELRTLILNTLTPYPDAIRAVAKALKEDDRER